MESAAVVCMVAYTNYLFDARVRREAETLASHGFRVLCLKTRDHDTPQQYVLNGVEIRELSTGKYRGKNAVAYLSSYLRFLSAATAACLRLSMTGKLDVVHVHNLPDFLVFAGLFPRLTGRKVVLDIHDTIPETYATKFLNKPLIRRLLRWEERLSASVAHKVICVNEPQRDTLVSRGIPASKTFISMNVPDPTIFGNSSNNDQPAVVDGRFDIVYHGTMAERLGVDLIIRAVGRLRARIPGVRLNLWGGGDDLSSFRALARKLDLTDLVEFKPEGFSLEELPAMLRPMHVGVVGNRRNPATDLMLPVKLMEYVALGIPVVAPRLRTIQHYFSEQMVSYYEPEDVESFADAIHRLFLQPQSRKQQADQAARFLTTHGWERQGPELLAFYQDLLEGRTT